MFEDLYTAPKTIERHRSAPLLQERLDYLRHYAEAGARPSTLRGVADDQITLIRLLDLRPGDRVTIAEVKSAVDKSGFGPDRRQNLRGRSVRWLRFAGMLEEVEGEPRHAHTKETGIYEAWMRDERGWSEATVRTYLFAANRFFDRLDERGVSLATVGFEDIDREVASWHARGYRRATVRSRANALRTFFRFAESRNWCAQELSSVIMPPDFRPDEPIPRGLEREEVVRLLATTEGDRPADVRDRAILMLLVAYGLRAGEVAGLRLDDFDWKNETLDVRCPKVGRTHRYPLSRGVGQAVLRYLREFRPPRPERTIFFSLTAPIRPLSRAAVSSLVGRRLRRLGVTGKCLGPHGLRHSAAQRLLDHGLSLKEVGDYLGHSSLSATAGYAKVQLGALREVADIDLEGLA